MTQDEISISAVRYIEVVYDIKLNHLPADTLMSQVKNMAVSKSDKTLVEYYRQYKTAQIKNKK